MSHRHIPDQLYILRSKQVLRHFMQHINFLKSMVAFCDHISSIYIRLSKKVFLACDIELDFTNASNGCNHFNFLLGIYIFWQANVIALYL